MPKHADIHIDDLMEMLLRGDTFEAIGRYYGVKGSAIEGRYHRNLTPEQKEKVRRKREQVWGMGVSA